MADAKPKIAEPRGTPPATRSIVDQMKTPAMIERFARYAPPGVDFKPLHASAALAIMSQPLLQEAKPLTLVQAMMGVTRLGLSINTPEGHAYLIPFKMGNDVVIQVVIGYRGFVELAFRSDEKLVIGGDVATMAEWEQHLFKFQKGTESFLHHTFPPTRLEGEEPPAYAYAVASTSGGEKFDVIPWAAIQRIRNGSQGYAYAKSRGEGSATYQKNPWVAHEWQMGVKTVLRRLTKTMRLSAAMASAVALDEMGEQRDIDFGSVVDIDPKDWSDVTEGREREDDGKAGEQHQVKTTEAKTEPKKTASRPVEKPEVAKDGDPRPEPPQEGEIVNKVETKPKGEVANADLLDKAKETAKASPTQPAEREKARQEAQRHVETNDEPSDTKGFWE